MKKSIFNMTFTLPPMVEMTEVEKELPTATDHMDPLRCLPASCPS